MDTEEFKSWFDRFYKEAKELFPKCVDNNSKLFPRMILKTISQLNLTDEEVEDAIYNLGSSDESIDAFYKDSEDNFHIFQFKSKKSLTDKDYIPVNNIHSEIDRFINSIDRLKNDCVTKNNRINDIKEEIMNNPKSKFNYYYYTQDLMNEEKIYEYEKLNKDKNLKVYDLNIITEKYSEYISNFSQQLTSLELPIEKFLDINDNAEKKSYILILNGYDIYTLMKENKFQLFKNNVRFYLGDKQSVNKKIIETAKENPTDFFNFNNGITIEATEITISEDSKNKVSLTNPSIINGAQTVNCIHSAYKGLLKSKSINNENLDLKGQRLQEHFKKIKILAKLTIIDNAEDEYSKILSKNVNSQNIIKEADYFSNLEEQIQLKRELGIYYNLFYEIKRGEITYFRTRKKEIENITKKQFKDFSTNYLKLEDFNRNYIAVFKNPGSSFHSVNNIFKKKDNYYELTIKKELIDNFDLTIKKMIFSQFLVDLVKEELNLYKKFYNSLYDINIPNEEKIILLNNTGFLYKEELKNNINDITNFEKNYGNLNLPLLGKGKYVYSYFIRFAIDNLNNKKDGLEYFERIIQGDLIQDYNKFKIKMRVWVYKICEFIQTYLEGLLEKGKTENQLTMNASFYLEECEKLIINEIIKINRQKRAEEYTII